MEYAIDFDDDPTTLEGAWKKMKQVRQFLRLDDGVCASLEGCTGHYVEA